LCSNQTKPPPPPRMSDDEEAGGFGGASESEEETGFGGADEEDEETGFGMGDEEEEDEEEVEAGFGALEEEEEEDGEGFGAAEEDEEEPEPEPVVVVKKAKKGVDFTEFAPKHFKDGNTGQYQLEAIEAPLLNVKGKNRQAAACQIFVHICKWMGITAVVGKATISTLKTAAKIIFPGLMSEMLRDETYCQLMKQMTGNPAVSSRARGTILLTLLVGSYLPSSKLMPTVRKFIADGPSGYVSYQNMLLRRTLANGARFEPPCSFELSSAKRKQIMRVPVKTDCKTKSMTQARLDPASTNQEWVAEIAGKCGVVDTVGYAIFIDRWDHGFSLNDKGGGKGEKGMHVMDAISKADTKMPAGTDSKVAANIFGQLSFRREFFTNDYDPMLDKEGTSITYHQLQVDIADGVFLCDTDDEWNELVAQMYYVERGDLIETEELVQWISHALPASVLAKNPAEKRAPAIEKIHAKATYTKKEHSRQQVQGAVIQFALKHWGSQKSFDEQDMRVLTPNGK